jgi:hypothetical protein
MKKLIAKICLWILGKLGYEKNYSRKNEIVISVDASGAIKQLDKLRVKAEQLKKELDGL